jgi:hypothetical protein
LKTDGKPLEMDDEETVLMGKLL